MKVSVTTNFRLDASKRVGPGYTPSDHKTITWSDSSDRKWLTGHLHWAMHNQRVVTLVPALESN